MPSLVQLQNFVPAPVKFFLKPYYRKIFKNRLHLIWNPTFRCNYDCSYCPVHTQYDLAGPYPKQAEKTAEEWLAAFGRLQGAMIYIAGGEPLLYRELPDVINALPEQHSILGMVSNLSVGAHVYKRIKKRIHVNASFHREFVTEEKFFAKIKELAGLFHIHVNIVGTRENLTVLRKLRDEFSRQEVALHVDNLVQPNFSYTAEETALLEEFMTPDRGLVDFENFSHKTCSAGKNYMAIMPDGETFTCAGGLGYLKNPVYSSIPKGAELSQYRMPNFFDEDFKLNDGYISCNLPCLHNCDRDAVIMKQVQ
jgi:organic radical activating enzyme